MSAEYSLSQTQLKLIQQAERIALMLDGAIQEGEISNEDTEKAQTRLNEIYESLKDDEELLGKKFYILYETQALLAYIKKDKDEANKLLEAAIGTKGNDDLFTKSANDLAKSSNIQAGISGEDSPEIVKSLAAVRSAATSSKAMAVLFGIVALIYMFTAIGVAIIFVAMAVIYLAAGTKLSELPEHSVAKNWLITTLVLSILSGGGIFPLLMLIESIKALKTMKFYEIWSANYRKD